MQALIKRNLLQLTNLYGLSHHLVLALLFIAAFGLRLSQANQPPLNFHATRQYRSLIIARGYYVEKAGSIPEWEKRVALVSKQRQRILEPPVMEFLVSEGYRLVGGEQFWLPRVLSSFFWLISGVFLYLISKRFVDTAAALASVAFYLFLPFAVSASRSFQPDPLMIMLMLASIYAMLRYDDQPTRVHYGIVILTSALTIFVKPISIFVIYSTFIAIMLFRKGIRKSISDRELLFFFIFTLLPVFTFYLYGIFVAGFLKDQATSSFLPTLLVDPFYWKGWIHNIRLTVGLFSFIAALFGIFMIRPGQYRYLMTGMWIGYALFCLSFSYHIATHDYYHLQLLPIVALTLGPIFSLVIARLLEINREKHLRVAVGLMGLIALALLAYEGRPRPLDSTMQREVNVAEEIGRQVNHAVDTVYLSSDYGLSLEYHGLLAGVPWPLISDLEWEQLAGKKVLNARERFNTFFSQTSPSHFIVLDLAAYEQQADLKKFLTDTYPILVQSDDYIIFDLDHLKR